MTLVVELETIQKVPWAGRRVLLTWERVYLPLTGALEI